MLNIIKSDLYRIFKGKAIYVTILVMSVLMIANAISVSIINIGGKTSANIGDGTGMEFMVELQNANTLKDFREVMMRYREYPLDQEMIADNINLYYFFIVIVVIVLCTDFSNKSIKNTLSSAISKKKYYLSKVILIFGICTFLVLFSNYFFYLLNILVNGKALSSSLLDITKYTLLQLPMIYGIISLLICFAFTFKKTSRFSTITIPFILVLQLIVIAFISLFRIEANWFYNYEFQYALMNLVISPTNAYILKCVLLGIFYIIIFNGIGYYTFKNTEIK